MIPDKKPMTPDEILAVMNATMLREMAVMMVLKTARDAHVLSIFRQLDARGQEAMINCGVFHMRYPKEAT